MLVLSRKSGQKLLIGDNIRITVVAGSRGDSVKLGFKAPVRFGYREELYNEIRQANEQAHRGGHSKAQLDSVMNLLPRKKPT
ncbi:MAG: carbon storage regulator [Vampirovibrionales bacterium]